MVRLLTNTLKKEVKGQVSQEGTLLFIKTNKVVGGGESRHLLFLPWMKCGERWLDLLPAPSGDHKERQRDQRDSKSQSLQWRGWGPELI